MRLSNIFVELSIFVLVVLSCSKPFSETDKELLYRYYHADVGETVACYKVDKTYSGALGSVHLVRFSIGCDHTVFRDDTLLTQLCDDTLLYVVGIMENRENDFVVPIGLPINLSDGRTELYLEYMNGDSLYRFVGDSKFWLDTAVWFKAIESAEPLGIMHRYTAPH